MDYSFLITYRDRNLENVRRCFESLKKQRGGFDYEIILVNFGSSKSYRDPLQELVKDFSRIKLVNVNTRGRFWCKSEALNIGLEVAKGEYIIVVDVDLIYCDWFLQVIAKYASPSRLLYYHCYIPPKGAADYDNFDFEKSHPYPQNEAFNTGLIVALREQMLRVGGYNEFFRIWGASDLEMCKRLLHSGLEEYDIPIEKASSVHQWHPKLPDSPDMPTTWYEYMFRTFHEKDPASTYRSTIGYVDRPALDLLRNPENPKVKKFTFRIPFAETSQQFAKAFSELQGGEALYIEQSFEWIEAGEGAKVAGIAQGVNRFFEKVGISYRLTEYKKFILGRITFEEVRDWLCYFQLVNEAAIYDYAFFIEGKKITSTWVKR